MKLAAISLVLVGCVTAPSNGADDEPNPTPSTPTTPTTQPVAASGTYDVRSELDLTIAALLPEQLYAMVQTLHHFAQNPAETMFDVAEDAGVPAVGEIRSALPSYVEDKLEGWINDEIAKLTIDGVSVTQYAENIAAVAEVSLGSFAIDSTLTVNGTTAVHALQTLDLTPAGLDAQFPLSALPAQTASCLSLADTFTIGEHAFSLAYGEYVWQALDDKFHVRATLGTAVNCPAIAATVASKCVVSVCVGHAAQLTEICERGLDEIVDRAHDQFTATRLDLLALHAGFAKLSADGRSMTGTWAAQINAGQGLRSVPATFTANR